MTPDRPAELPEWLAQQLPFRRSMLTVNGKAMHVMEQGEGRPVLMLHGNPTWGFLWRKVALELRNEPVRVVMPDLLGLGLSEKIPPGEHTLELHALQVAQLVRQLDLRDVVLVVQDWGGAIGCCAAAELKGDEKRRPARAGAESGLAEAFEEPGQNEGDEKRRPDRAGAESGLAEAFEEPGQSAERVTGFVALNTILGPPRVGFKPTPFHRFARLPVISEFAFRVLGFPQRALGWAQGDSKSMAGDVGRAYRWVLRDRATNGAPLALARMVPNDQHHPSIPRLQQSEAWAQGFEGPRAMVWGKRDPVLGTSYKRVGTLLRQPPLTMTEAGHFLQEEVPSEIAAAIRQVLKG